MMIKTTIQIDGMMCGMCETHIQDAIRKHFKVKKSKHPAARVRQRSYQRITLMRESFAVS